MNISSHTVEVSNVICIGEEKNLRSEDILEVVLVLHGGCRLRLLLLLLALRALVRVGLLAEQRHADADGGGYHKTNK